MSLPYEKQLDVFHTNHEDDSAPRSPGSVESSRHNHSQLGNGNLLHRQTMSVGGRVSWTAIALIVTLVIVSQSEAYVTSPSLRRRSHYSARVKEDSEVVTKLREDGSKVTLYLYPSKRSITAASMKSRRIHRIATPSGGTSSTTELPAMSASVLAPSDILPAFHTAHGLLSPEVVRRIGDMHDLDLGSPLHKFLMTYKRHGPMSCLPMLSDPCVLPVLTKAMREIA